MDHVAKERNICRAETSYRNTHWQKKYVSSSLKAFEFLIKLLSDLMLVLGDEAGPAYLPVFLQLVMCCTAGSIDSG